MKYLVLSFDDAQYDFYENVFPLLKEENIKATLNVISGFSDNSIKHISRCCNIKELQEMTSYVEIALHTDSHQRKTTINDLNICLFKLSNWVKNDRFGLVLPFNQKINKDILNWAKENNILYIRTGENKNIKFIDKILFKLKLISHERIFSKNNCKIRKKNGIKILYSIPISITKSSTYYTNVIKNAKDNSIITLMFHSVFKTKNECKTCTFPEGSYQLNELKEVIKWAKLNNVKILTQRESLLMN